jgi:hypothetical protein
MLYLVRIGSEKSGTFYELLTKAVSSEIGLNHVQQTFEKKYEGLTVKVEKLEIIPETISGCEMSYLENIWVQYTDEERAIHDKWCEQESKSGELKNELERHIRERYKKFNYTAICARNDIQLETDSEGTLIRHLPLKADVFLSKVGEGGSL